MPAHCLVHTLPESADDLLHDLAELDDVDAHFSSHRALVVAVLAWREQARRIIDESLG